MAEDYLKIALERLNQIDKLSYYSSYLKDEWISTKEDLWLTLDESTWHILKLPARLKLELRKVFLEEQDNTSFPTSIKGEVTPSGKLTELYFILCFLTFRRQKQKRAD